MPRPEIPELTPSELQGKLGDVYLLDVRPVSMYQQGHNKLPRREQRGIGSIIKTDYAASGGEFNP
jgi:hypothetical protein